MSIPTPSSGDAGPRVAGEGTSAPRDGLDAQWNENTGRAATAVNDIAGYLRRLGARTVDRTDPAGQDTRRAALVQLWAALDRLEEAVASLSPAEPVPVRRSPASGDITGTILVVDDDELVQTLAAKLLERAGYDVVVAASGKEALAYMAGAIPDVVLCDINMPGGDGFTLLRHLREDPRTESVPLVFLTSRSDEEDIVHALGLGADDYLTKPVRAPELLARVTAKVNRPPMPAALVPTDRSTGLLTSARYEEERDREVERWRRGGGTGVIARMRLVELPSVAHRVGRAPANNVVGTVGEALGEVIRPLDQVGIADDGDLLLLLVDRSPDDAAAQLTDIGELVAGRSFEVSGEVMRFTPVTGFTEFESVDTASELDRRAGLATDYAELHLDLTPRRWEPSMDGAPKGAPTKSGRRGFVEHLRLPVQIAATFVIGLVLPFLAYWGLDALGYDITSVMYMVVVVTLLLTGLFIWVEGFLSLRPEEPPDEPATPYPPATAIIAAYLPNEAATLLATIETFLALDYPAPLQVILAYNTPATLPIEARLRELEAQHEGFMAYRVADSNSKAQNVNAALVLAEGEFVGVFDADHQPDPDAFRRAWRWLADGNDVVQGHCVTRNGSASWLARMIAVEFEAIYAVSHPGRARMHRFGIFGGSNGFWRTDRLHAIRMRGSMLTEDIDSSLRVIAQGGRIVSDPGLVSRELGTTTIRQVWNQRMRWAQGWFQVSIRHFPRAIRLRRLSVRQRLGIFHLLAWREVYPWLTLQMFPLLAYWIWSRGADSLDWFIPVFVLTTLFTLSVGPGQAFFAYRRAVPEIRRHRSWFVGYLVFASLFYTEFKNVIVRVAHLKQLIGESDWRVTPRSADEEAEDAADGRP